MLEPAKSEMLRAVVRLIEPVPVTATLLVEFGRLIGPVALAERLLFAARVRPPAKAMELNSLPAEPSVRLELKSVVARLLAVSVSPELLGLIVAEAVGLVKNVVANLLLPLRSWAMLLL